MISSKPYQYTKGWVEFYKLRFKVTPDVLIPRPETELLVDEVLSFISKLPATNYQLPITILDLGTGSGNIAISLAKNLHKQLPTRQVGIRIIATDISQKALKVAKQNAKLHGVENKITFLQSDLLSVFCHPDPPAGGEGSQDSSRDFSLITRNDNLIIVTNLPYIPSARIPYLDYSVKDFEPHVALDGGEDGFELYRKLFRQIKEKGWKPKLIVCEIDYTHAEIAIGEAQKLVVSKVEPYFPEAEIEVKTDLAKKQRILVIKFPS